jgi:crotonobetainyl-CoA:carnitine CoA-transferase CaiB-like acyl-CoA transferase
MQPFSGIKVLDFTHVLAGPFCTYQLAVMGADVIKIESPDRHDMMRSESVSDDLAEEGRGTQFLSQSANKRSVAIDFITAEGAEVVRQLATGADVLVENFRTGVLERAGLGYDALAELNPELIYCSMTGFGQTGPKAQHPAYDNVIQAFSGLMAATGSATTAPVRVGPPVLDYGTGAQAAFAIASALFQRSRTGSGQYIDVAMLDAAMMLMSSAVVDTEVRGSPPPPSGNANAANAGYACYDTLDGLLMIGAFTGKQRADLWRTLNQYAQTEEGTATDASADALTETDVQEQLDFDKLTPAEKLARVPADSARLQKWLLQRSAEAWEDLLNVAGVPAARVRTLDEALAHPQLASRQSLQDATGLPAAYAGLKVPVAAFSYSHNGPKIRQHAPVHGQHSREVLRECGVDEVRFAELLQAGVVDQA